MTQSPMLSVRNLNVAIRTRTGTVRAVDGVSFDIQPGETLALVGESGSGKTMSAMSLIGLTPVGASVTTTGAAHFGGRDLLTLSESELVAIRGKQIGTVFQDPSAALNPLMTVASQMRETLPAAERRGRRAAAHIADLLVEVGLGEVPGIARRYPHELSGGQQQRVAIAIALAGNPALLIADEPTTALDMTVQAQILALLTRLQQARRMAMLLITHDLGIVANHARDVLVMRRGRMVEQGPVPVVLGSPRQDYTRMLLENRPHLRAAASVATALAADAPPLLAVDDLVITYPGRGIFARPVTAVAGVSLAVAKGQALGLVGESGSGKSTIAKAAVGLVRADAGSIALDGVRLGDASRMTRAQRARVQYIFQDPYGALNPRLSVEQLVGEPFAIVGRPRPERRDAVVALLDEVGLSSEYLGRLPRQLSGGERQRVNIARALASRPELLICDEIVSALDVSIQAQVLDLLKRLQRARGLTFLFISHDLAVVAQICDRVLVLQAGKVVEEGPVRSVFQQSLRPYTKALLDAAHALDQRPVGQGISAVRPIASSAVG